ncbi:MAG TPA: tetratricopeptide repeat protein [Vicinamibacterales bacterium]|nr:tetratricopeptide repeat protein [Vicinamibacterales bacterium]
MPRCWPLPLVLVAVLVPGIGSAQQNVLPVPQPRLDDLEPAVAEQIRATQQRAAGIIAKGSAARDLADAYGSLGRVYHAYEFLDSAEPAYVNARRLASGNSEWPHLLGVLYQQIGRLEEAAEALTAARRLQPRDHAAAVYLGDIFLSLNRLVDARDQFQSVIDVFPAVARRGLGDVAMRERKFAEAVEHYRAVLDRVPQAAAVHYSLAMAYRGMGRLDDAREHLQRRGPEGVHADDPILTSVQSLVRGERAWVMQGRRAYDAGQFAAAADAFTKALEAAPSSVVARVNLGSALVQMHRDADAIPYFRDALRVSPEEPGVAEALIGALVRVGRDTEAIETFSRTKSYRPDDEGSLVGVAILLAARERFREALVLLEDAHQRFPDRTATATTLARLLASSPAVSLRDGTRALDIAMAVNDAEPTPVHAETVALALAELGRCGEAMEWMKRAVASAERGRNVTEAARLKGEMPKYQRAACRP